MPIQANIFHDLPATPLDTEQFLDILKAPGVRIERIVSTGQADPPGHWQSQGWDEWVLLLEGAAAVLVEQADGTVADTNLFRGDHLLIPADTRHRVNYTDPACVTIWLAIHIVEPLGSADLRR